MVGLTDPNPRVGCVLGRSDGTLVATGATQAAGGPHAEVMALRQARAHGADLRGATAWVTLEPCAHHGRTPPCCDALIEAGLERVVVALQDPFPAVAGHGIERLRAAGIEVVLAHGEIAVAARDINIGFLSRVVRGRAWTRLKSACSLDGRTALPNGVSQWITSPEARRDGHAWRRRASVVVTGIGTVLADDPRMDVRLVETPRQPRRAVIDSSLRTPHDAALLDTPGALIYCARHGASDVDGPWAALGAELIHLPNSLGQVDLRQVLEDLTRRSCNEVHLEAGARLTGAWLQAGLADELLIYMAPRLLGDGVGIAALPALTELPARLAWDWLDATPVGPDLRLRLRAKDSDPDRWCPVPP